LISRTTKSLIIKAAEELILSYGYQGFSYNDIATIVKIRKSSIHYHFPLKEDLGLAFIDKYSRMFSLWGKRVGNISNKDKLINFCNMYAGLSENGTHICPIGMVAAEYHNMPDKIQEKSQQLILQVEFWLESMINAGVKAGEFKPNLNPGEISRHIINAMSGSLKMARIFKDMDRISKARETLIEQIFIN
jgi:TetR/AcrR family transcriptional repressor of nem operon